MDTKTNFTYMCHYASAGANVKSILRQLYDNVELPAATALEFIPYQLCNLPPHCEDKFRSDAGPADKVQAYSVALGYRTPAEAQEIAAVVLPFFMQSVEYLVNKSEHADCAVINDLRQQTQSVVTEFISSDGTPIVTAGMKSYMRSYNIGFFITVRVCPYSTTTGPGDIIMELNVALGLKALQRITDFYVHAEGDLVAIKKYN